ncbi:uncharacterized protein T069G_11587 [Trichoderma breve]|uniref:Uncharacterized protein n=1 Tax=Trichoderma breve TaxID=2034170 RepID=A0A9W9B6Y4_9HYPO|nr:uncharacterized protein T069G_11587 [Trichoderma breve]KAJ4854608.1 hypothetical protein T069G_11587 [Trichoderma breve]
MEICLERFATSYAEEQQQSSRKRKRANSGSYATGPPAIHIHNIIPGQPDTTLTNSRVRSTPETASLRYALEGLGMRDDVAEEYFAWHGSRVRRQALKEEYDRACDLALGKGLDLELIHDDQDGVYQFLTDHGIMEGPARRVVRDVEIFLNQQQYSSD